MEIFESVAAFLAVVLFVITPVILGANYNWSGFVVIGSFVSACLIAAAVAGYVFDHQPKQTVFELSTLKWTCSSTYTERVFTGKVWVNETRCAQYSVNAPTVE